MVGLGEAREECGRRLELLAERVGSEHKKGRGNRYRALPPVAFPMRYTSLGAAIDYPCTYAAVFNNSIERLV